jgi:divalent metal cation (Fe/Co/Zn/Cd) transporter
VKKMAEVKEYVKGFILGVVGFSIALTVAQQVIMPALANSTIPLVTAAIGGTIVGAGLLFFLIGLFF